MSDREQARWNSLDDQSKLDIERIRAYNKQQLERDLDVTDPGYPVGDMYGSASIGLFD